MEEKEISYNFEALKLAKEIAHNEYVDIRAKIHNKWVADSDVEWRTKRTKLPYPSFPSYPSEQEILTRAQKILDFLNRDSTITITKKEETNNVLPLQSLEPISLEMESSLPISLQMESIQPPLLPAPQRLHVEQELVSTPILLKDKKESQQETKTKISTGKKIATQLMNKITAR